MKLGGIDPKGLTMTGINVFFCFLLPDNRPDSLTTSLGGGLYQHQLPVLRLQHLGEALVLCIAGLTVNAMALLTQTMLSTEMHM